MTPASIAAASTELSCEVRRITLDATQTVPGRTFSYLWEGGATTARLQADTVGTYRVTITDDASGCENTASIEITGGFIPTVFDISAPAELCEGAALDVTATATEATSYSWTGPDNFSAATANFSVPAVSQASTGTYELVVTKTDGCNDTTTFDLFVNLLPRVEIVSNGPLCTGEELVLEETIGRGFSFAWSGPDGFSSADPSPSIPNAGPANVGEYSLLLTDANGCQGSDQTTVVINDNPTVDIRTTSPVCKGVDLDLVVEAESSLTWNWTFPDNTTATGDSLNILNAQVQEGTYRVEAVNANGCTVTGQADVRRAVEIDLSSGFLVGNLACVGDSIRFVDYTGVTDLDEGEILAALDTSQIIWRLGDGRTSDELNPFIIYDAPGLYDISLEIINGDCSYLSIEKTIEVVPCSSLSPETFLEANLFPSPSRGNFTIDLALQEASNLRIDLMTPSGKILLTKFYQNRQDLTENFQVNEAGIYLVRVRHKYGVKTIKTVVYK
ncbi:MAG: T9SS type A sorting domain-containing protein [Bacteroidota bacterium]